MADFLKKVADGFRLCGVDVEKSGRVGVAVSGGADSVSLLLACVEIFGRADVSVLTVNHNIRPENESAGDASFVAFLCGK
ncbi:MAG: tRNA(Ile)-lysidine synthetase, partial [Treponema sp.]|nr:tRNA(Ile)-lysidine synthetase [Treponema sp.]